LSRLHDAQDCSARSESLEASIVFMISTSATPVDFCSCECGMNRRANVRAGGFRGRVVEHAAPWRGDHRLLPASSLCGRSSWLKSASILSLVSARWPHSANAAALMDFDRAGAESDDVPYLAHHACRFRASGSAFL
jgi:hypothetical protein